MFTLLLNLIRLKAFIPIKTVFLILLVSRLI